MSGRRKGLAVTGYTLSNIARPMLGLAGSWPMVLLLRSIDRMGKGLRSAPRDALVVDATPAHMRGYAFGFHRALDNGGAVAGSLVAAAALAWSGMSLERGDPVVGGAGFLGGAAPGLGVTEKDEKFAVARHSAAAPATLPPLRWSVLSLPMRRYLLVLMLFTFGRASETFILLLGHQLGVGVVELLLLWAALNLAKAATSTWGGQLADSMGRGASLLIGWTAFSLSFLLLAAVEDGVGSMDRQCFLWLFCRHERRCGTRHHQRPCAAARTRHRFRMVSLDDRHRGDSRGAAVRLDLAVSKRGGGLSLRRNPGRIAALLLRTWAWPAKQAGVTGR